MKKTPFKILCILLALALIASAFSGCSGKVGNLDENVEVVEDSDDVISVNMLMEDESDTFELTDNNGNVLTLVPIYGCDGTTMIAAYIMSVKDAAGNELDQTAYPNLKAVILVDLTDEVYSLVYENDELVTVKSLADDDGYIIAMQDTMDYDEDGDKEEYFKVSTKLDSTSHLFIKLDSEDNATPINVTVEENADGTKTVTDEKGNKTTAKDTKDAKGLNEVVEEDKKQQEEDKKQQEQDETTTKPADEPTTQAPDDSGDEDDPTAGYTCIVLSKNGQVKTDATNVSVEGSVASGGTEIHIDGAGDNSKYYITSETDSFLGQIVLELHVEDDVEVKFNNVTINTQKKTAVKLVNADAVKDKESDSEESGSGLGTTGSSLNTAAPKVELSFTGTNSFTANGSGKNGTIYSECKLGIKGHGTAYIDGGANLSGICSTESITIKNSTLYITSKAKQGISCDKKVLINSGASINIESLGDGIHCNKFELDGVDADGVSADSTVTISSIYSTNCADGIDADNQIIIDGGTLTVTATSTGKYALKVRKVINGASNGYFEINGGVVTASGSLNSTPTSCGQYTVVATSRAATTISAGDYSSSSDTTAFICSPCGATSASTSSASGKVTWKGNIGTASL